MYLMHWKQHAKATVRKEALQTPMRTVPSTGMAQSLSLLPLLLLSLLLPPLRRRRSSLRRRSLLSFLCLRLFSLPRFSFFSFFLLLLQAGSGGGSWSLSGNREAQWQDDNPTLLLLVTAFACTA